MGGRSVTSFIEVLARMRPVSWHDLQPTHSLEALGSIACCYHLSRRSTLFSGVFVRYRICWYRGFIHRSSCAHASSVLDRLTAYSTLWGACYCLLDDRLSTGVFVHTVLSTVSLLLRTLYSLGTLSSSRRLTLYWSLCAYSPLDCITSCGSLVDLLCTFIDSTHPS